MTDGDTWSLALYLAAIVILPVDMRPQKWWRWVLFLVCLVGSWEAS